MGVSVDIPDLSKPNGALMRVSWHTMTIHSAVVMGVQLQICSGREGVTVFAGGVPQHSWTLQEGSDAVTFVDHGRQTQHALSIQAAEEMIAKADLQSDLWRGAIPFGTQLSLAWEAHKAIWRGET